jgi:hypothetical protein
MSKERYQLPRRLPDGTIDFSYYQDQAHQLRSLAYMRLLDRFGGLLKWLFNR